MEWAEELKMSIRKTTARKGRRSKSRDVLKDTAQISASAISHSTRQINDSNNTEFSIDITLDLKSQQQDQNHELASAANISTPIAGNSSGADISSILNSPSDSKPPPALRRISGGWADSSVGTKLKSKKGSLEDDRFGLKSSIHNSPTDDDIPVIPDLDDINDDMVMNEVAEPPSVHANRVITLKELNTDILTQKAFSAIEDVDLSILIKCLQPQESLDEADEVWEWDKLFTDVVAEINSDKPLENKIKNLELKPDELPKLIDE